MLCPHERFTTVNQQKHTVRCATKGELMEETSTKNGHKGAPMSRFVKRLVQSAALQTFGPTDMIN